jgi:hypothetical protein
MPAEPDDTIDDGYYDYIAYHSKQISQVERVQIIVAIISTFCSASVVFILLYKRSVLLKDRPFIYCILMIAIADMLTSFTYSFGYPTGQIQCVLQGFFGVLFSRASWLYTVGLVIQLTSVVLYRQFLCTNRKLILIIAFINVILQLLPFSTGNGYGGSVGSQVCFYAKWRGSYYSLHVWEEFCYFAVQIVSFAIILLATVALFIYSKRPGSSPILYEQLENAWTTIILYPATMMISWLPNMIYGWYFDAYINRTNNYPPSSLIISDSLIVLNSLYGIFLTLIFFCCTKDATNEYIALFQQMNTMVQSLIPSFLKSNDIESNDDGPYFKM